MQGGRGGYAGKALDQRTAGKARLWVWVGASSPGFVLWIDLVITRCQELGCKHASYSSPEITHQEAKVTHNL